MLVYHKRPTIKSNGNAWNGAQQRSKTSRHTKDRAAINQEIVLHIYDGAKLSGCVEREREPN